MCRYFPGMRKPWPSDPPKQKLSRERKAHFHDSEKKLLAKPLLREPHNSNYNNNYHINSNNNDNNNNSNHNCLRKKTLFLIRRPLGVLA